MGTGVGDNASTPVPISANAGRYSVVADVDGNGRVDAKDLLLVRRRLLTRLPTAVPMAVAPAATRRVSYASSVLTLARDSDRSPLNAQ